MRELIEGRDYQIVDDGMGGLNSYLRQTGKNAFRKAISLADRALSGKKGKAATTAIIMAGLTTDKDGLNNVYHQHAGVINRYFEYVDLQAVSDLIGLEETVASSKSAAALKHAGFLSMGIAIGIAGLTFINRKRSSQ
jgi:hypothetical protein